MSPRSRGPVDPRLLRHARPARAGIAAIGVVEAVSAGLLLAQALALTDLVVALWRGAPASGALGVLVAAVAGRVVTSWAAARLAQRTASAVRSDLREQVLARTLALGPAWVERFGRARLSAVLTQGLPALDAWFTRYLPALVPGVLLPPLVLVVLAFTDLESAITVAVTLPLIPVFAILLGRAAQSRADRQWSAQRTLAAHFLDTVRGLPTLRAHRRAQRQVGAVAAVTDAHRRATMSVLRIAFLSSTALDLVGTLSVGLVAVTAGMRLAGGTLDLHTALLVILLAPEAYRPLREVGARFHDSADAAAVVDDVDQVLTAPLPVLGSGPAAGSAEGSGCAGSRCGARTPPPSSTGSTSTPSPASCTPSPAPRGRARRPWPGSRPVSWSPTRAPSSTVWTGSRTSPSARPSPTRARSGTPSAPVVAPPTCPTTTSATPSTSPPRPS